MLMPMTICIMLPGPGGCPSFTGFRATQYTYPPAPISPDPESTRQLQQLLGTGVCSGEVGDPGAARGAGLAEEAASGGVATWNGSKGWVIIDPMFTGSATAVGAFQIY